MDGTPRYVGTRIGAALAAQGRKRRWLADLLGVSESYLSRAPKVPDLALDEG